MSYEIIRRKLAAGETIILDGGTGTDIQRRGAPMSGDTWCADVNATHLHIVQDVHEEYIRCGAEVITANTFASSALSFNAYGRDADMLELDRLAVSAAKAAARGTQVAIAGSMSTMRPSVPGTDRTDFSKTWTEAEARPLFKAKANNLKNSGVDFIMMEMMRDADFSVWATEAAQATGLPVWIGISVEKREDGELSGFGRSDQLLKDFAPQLAKLEPDVMCIMHSSPEVTGAALDILRRSWNGPLAAYPECGYFKSPDWVFTDITPASLTAFAKSWHAQGAIALGGCCGIGPSHIKALHKEFAA